MVTISPTQIMNLSDKGRKFIQSFEGCSLAAYQDSIGVWTIGYGHIQGVKQGDVITKERAEILFAMDLRRYENGVFECVSIALPQSQFDALVSFAYNCGLGNLLKSTLLKKVNAKDLTAKDEFLKWNKAGGKVIKGLTRRREAEAKLFSEGIYVA